jgi:16S rRNA (uracil1498-N3)-methyltransferase
VSRWRRKAIEAAKQSGQSTTMDVEAQTSLTELFETCGSKTLIFWGEPQGAERTLAEELMKAASGTNEDSALLVIIGPEAGLTDEECAQVETAGGKAVSLGPTILRIETAAVAAAVICGCWTQMNTGVLTRILPAS